MAVSSFHNSQLTLLMVYGWVTNLTSLAKALEWRAGPSDWWNVAQTSGSPFAVAPVLEGFRITKL